MNHIGSLSLDSSNSPDSASLALSAIGVISAPSTISTMSAIGVTSAMSATSHAAPSATRRRAAAPSRLPRWLRRSVRAWARCARWWAGHAPRSSRARGMLCVAEMPELEAQQAQAERRCGWFDSSQDLREGLCISEHDSGDAVCAQLPVMAWVQLQLSGWRPSLGAARPELELAR
jgi:hypothetical protein